MDFNHILKEMVEHYDLTTLGAILTFLTILATFWKQVGEPLYDLTLRPIAKLFYSIYESPTKLEKVELHIQEMDKKLDLLLAEFKPNSGSSMRDQVTTLKAMLTSVVSRQWLFAESSADPIWESDPSGYCLRANKALLALSGRDFESGFKGNNWEQMIHIDDRDAVWKEWNAAIAKRRVYSITHRIINSTGKVFRVDATAYPIFDGTDTIPPKLTGWVGQYKSVTEVK